MLGLSRFVLRHKGAVLVFWLVVLVAGGAASAKLSSRLSPSFALPGAPGYQANQQILRLYGNGGPGMVTCCDNRALSCAEATTPAAIMASQNPTTSSLWRSTNLDTASMGPALHRFVSRK